MSAYEMGLFGRKEKTVDWTENYHRQKDRLQNLKEGVQQSAGTENPAPQNAGNFNFLANLATSASSSQTPSSYPSEGDESSDERKRKLARRLMEMTEKIEEMSTQIYHLSQRVELLERKNKTGFE